jgi:hypothetical protein
LIAPSGTEPLMGPECPVNGQTQVP